MTTMEQVEATLARITERQEQGVYSLEAFKAQLATSQEAADRRAAEADRLFAKTKAEADKRSQEIDLQLKELGKQIGGLGNKFGSFTEGLLLPSVERILREQFGVTDFYMRLNTYREDGIQELDGFGFVNGTKNIGFIIEVKSHLDKSSVEQTLKQLQRFGKFHPQYKGMTLYGIIAAVDAVSVEQRSAVYNAGLYLVTVNEDVAEMPTPPQDFTPFALVAE